MTKCILFAILGFIIWFILGFIAFLLDAKIYCSYVRFDNEIKNDFIGFLVLGGLVFVGMIIRILYHKFENFMDKLLRDMYDNQ